VAVAVEIQIMKLTLKLDQVDLVEQVEEQVILSVLELV
jgi:hypothetical protein